MASVAAIAVSGWWGNSPDPSRARAPCVVDGIADAAAGASCPVDGIADAAKGASTAADRRDGPASIVVTDASEHGFTADIRLRATPPGTMVPASAGWLIGVPTPAGARLRVLEEDVGPAPWPPRPLQARDEVARAVELDGRIVEVHRARSSPAAVSDGATPGAAPSAVTLEDAGWLRGVPIMRLAFRTTERAAVGRPADRVITRRALVRVTYAVPANASPAPASRRAGCWPVRVDDPTSPFGRLEDRLLLNAPWVRALAEPVGPSSAGPRPGGGAGVPRARSLRAEGPILDAAGDPRALKVVVDRDGPVSVAATTLSAAGWALGDVDPDRITLTAGGEAVAITVVGAQDGRLDPTDRLVFHGRAARGEYTRENVYWLTPDGAAARIAARSGAPDPALRAVDRFTETLRFEEDTVYYLSMHRLDGDDRWMWGDRIGAGGVWRTSLHVPDHVAESEVARVRVRLQGYTDDPISPDHHARVLVNGQVAHEARFDGYGMHVLAFDVAGSALRDGQNAFALESVVVDGAAVNEFFVNWIDLEHVAAIRATGERRSFAAPRAGRATFEVSGFASASVAVHDVTDPRRPVAIVGAEVSRDPAGPYRVRFTDVASAGSRYEAFTPAGAPEPPRVVANRATAWRDPAHGADYILLTHADFADALQPLAEHRSRAGLRVATVLVEDVYDEFSSGVFDPRAIRAFLRYAADRWVPPAPTYVVLVGESNMDYRGAYGHGPPNFVPSMQIDLDSGKAGSSDVWFAQLQGDVVPDVLLGRLPVATPEQARAVVGKIVRYDSHSRDERWRRRAVLVADDTDAEWTEPLCDELANLLPAGCEPVRYYARRFPRNRSLRGAIGAAIEDGALVVAFAGHGNVDLWGTWDGGGHIFANDDIAALANGDRLPALVAASCMTGWLSHPLKPVAMSELWLTQPGGGGVAAWASSGIEPFGPEAALTRRMFAGLHDGRDDAIGALAVEAAAGAFAEWPAVADTVRQYALVGDPATVVEAGPCRGVQHAVLPWASGGR